MVADKDATQSPTRPFDPNDDVIALSPLLRHHEIDFEEEGWEDEGKMLFEWTQNLSPNNLAS